MGVKGLGKIMRFLEFNLILTDKTKYYKGMEEVCHCSRIVLDFLAER